MRYQFQMQRKADSCNTNAKCLFHVQERDLGFNSKSIINKKNKRPNFTQVSNIERLFVVVCKIQMNPNTFEAP